MYIYIDIYHRNRNMYIYTTQFMLYILPQNNTIDLILRMVLPIIIQPEAMIYTPLYKHHKGHLLSTGVEFSENYF